MKKLFIEAEIDIKVLSAEEALLNENSIVTPDIDFEEDLGWDL